MTIDLERIADSAPTPLQQLETWEMMEQMISVHFIPTAGYEVGKPELAEDVLRIPITDDGADPQDVGGDFKQTVNDIIAKLGIPLRVNVKSEGLNALLYTTKGEGGLLEENSKRFLRAYWALLEGISPSSMKTESDEIHREDYRRNSQEMIVGILTYLMKYPDGTSQGDICTNVGMDNEQFRRLVSDYLIKDKHLVQARRNGHAGKNIIYYATKEARGVALIPETFNDMDIKRRSGFEIDYKISKYIYSCGCATGAGIMRAVGLSWGDCNAHLDNMQLSRYLIAATIEEHGRPQNVYTLTQQGIGAFLLREVKKRNVVPSVK